VSIDAMSWAFKQDLPPAEKLVLLSLADHHNSGTGVCIPGQASVALQTSMSVRTVQRHMVSLEQRGLIVRKARFRGEGRGRTSDAYVLQGDNLARCFQPDNPSTTKATIQDDQGDTVVVGTVREPEENNNLAAKPRERDILFETLAEVAGHDIARLTSSERGRLNKACKELKSAGADPEQIRAAARTWRVTYPTATLTPTALAAHWSTLNKTVVNRRCYDCDRPLNQHDEELCDTIRRATWDR
jgi:DNA-binding transcriptional ArsR family regulator